MLPFYILTLQMNEQIYYLKIHYVPSFYVTVFFIKVFTTIEHYMVIIHWMIFYYRMNKTLNSKTIH